MSHHLIWAEIDLAAIAHNTRELRRITHPNAKLLVAVKADGYGHGALQVARTALANGADALGVARIEEGIALRRAGIREPILIFGYTDAARAEQLIAHDLMPSLFSLDSARAMASAAVALSAQISVHIKIDTGMGRLGLPCDALRLDGAGRAADEIMQMAQLKGLRFAGIFTHFATSDDADKHYAQLQLARFRKILTQLKSAGLAIPLRHAANSGAIIDMPETHLDMVRAGISVYGLYPSDEMDRARIDLRPALTLKAKIVHLKRVPPGTKISYGCTYQTSTVADIATIPAGYADGFNRRLSNQGAALVGGQRVPIVGRVCMDLCMIDVSKVPKVKMGDEAVLIGHQGEAVITADEVAARLGTINYEVVSALTARVPRVYRKPQ